MSYINKIPELSLSPHKQAKGHMSTPPPHIKTKNDEFIYTISIPSLVMQHTQEISKTINKTIHNVKRAKKTTKKGFYFLSFQPKRNLEESTPVT